MNKTKKCSKKMNFDDCEQMVARSVVAEAIRLKSKARAMSAENIQANQVVEAFIRKSRCVCYGGTAINNLLPTTEQFYDPEVDLPDYDVYSPTPIAHAKALADFFRKRGFEYVEAKSGVHVGTFKVFVNFAAVADITFMEPPLFKAVAKAAIMKNGILYADPNLLRQSMYLELSRPNGDIERWNKILPRLMLLNKHYPMKATTCALQQPMVNKLYDFKKQNELAALIESNFVAQKVMFIGGFADALYAVYMKKPVRSTPDYDVVSLTPHKTAHLLKDDLVRNGYEGVNIQEHKAIGDLISKHFEIKLGKDTVAFVYGTTGCHSYNVVERNGNELRVATLDTLLSFYLAFLYVNRPYMNKERILCMSSLLFQVLRTTMSEQKGVLKRFSLTCYGVQDDMAALRKKKTVMRGKLKRGTPEWDNWFLDYRP